MPKTDEVEKIYIEPAVRAERERESERAHNKKDAQRSFSCVYSRHCASTLSVFRLPRSVGLEWMPVVSSIDGRN